MKALDFEQQAELEALEGFEAVVQYFCGERGGRAAQIFAGFMTPKQHRRLAELRMKAKASEVSAEVPSLAGAAA